MTTSFQAAPAADGGAAKPTSFQAPGDNGNQGGQADDKTVVFEHGGRKYTAADLVKKIDSSDQFIATLKAEGAENRSLLEQANTALAKTLSAAELLKKVQEGGAAAAAPTAAAPAAAAQPAAAPTAQEVAALVVKQQQEAQAAIQADANFAEVQTALTKTYGQRVDAKVDEIAAAVGMTRDAAIALARSSPKAFLRMFPEVNAAPPRSFASAGPSLNTQAVRPDPSAKAASGYTTAQGMKAQTAVYLNKLKDLGF